MKLLSLHGKCRGGSTDHNRRWADLEERPSNDLITDHDANRVRASRGLSRSPTQIQPVTGPRTEAICMRRLLTSSQKPPTVLNVSVAPPHTVAQKEQGLRPPESPSNRDGLHEPVEQVKAGQWRAAIVSPRDSTQC